MQNNNLILFTTHVINKAVISEYKKFLNIPGYDCILVIDNEKLKLEPEYSKLPQQSINYKYVVQKEFFDCNILCLLFDKSLHDKLKLPHYAKHFRNASFIWITWYNADYRFYYAKNFFPNYDYYWQFDYDVFMNGPSYKPFFDKYENNDEDLLITKYRPETKNSSWMWTKNIDWIYDDNVQLYGSFFPISRLSNRAVDFLYKKRLEHAELFSKVEASEDTHWVICEEFVPTELKLNGYTCGNIDEANVRLKEYDLSEDRIFECPDNKLYHPVKGGFIKRIENLKKQIEKTKK